MRFLTDGIVTCILQQPDGRFIIGGIFSAVNGVARASLARLEPNGALDRTWNPSLASDFDPKLGNVYASEVNINAMAQSGDALFVAGFFDAAGNYERRGLAKISLSDGSVDPAWCPAPRRYDDQGRRLRVLPDFRRYECLQADERSLYVSGEFSRLGGFARHNLAKLSVEGSGAADARWNPGPAGVRIKKILLVSDSIYAIGSLDTPARFGSYLAKLDKGGTGAADRHFQPKLGDSAPADVATDGANLFLVGQLQPPDLDSASGVSSLGAVKISAATGVRDTSWSPLPDGSASAVAISQGQVYLIDFFSLTSAVEPTRADAITGAVDSSWSAPTSAVRSEGIGFGSGALLPFDQGVLIAGKLVAQAGAHTGLIDLDLHSRSLVESFGARVQDPGSVRTIVPQANGGLLVGGDFLSVDGAPQPYLARLQPDLTLDPAWMPNPDGPVSSIVESQGFTYIGGSFTAVNGTPSGGVARLGPAGLPDEAWSVGVSMQFGGDSSVSALSIDGNFLYVGGDFDQVSAGSMDHPAPRANLARFTKSVPAQVDEGWTPDLHGIFVNRLALIASDLYVGGYRDAETTVGVLSRISATGDGSRDPIWNPQFSPFTFVQALAARGDSVYAGLTNGNGQVLLKLDRFGKGTVDAAWKPLSTIAAKVDGCTALAVSGASLYAALSTFTSGTSAPLVLRLDAGGSGAIETSFTGVSDFPDGGVNTMAVRGSDLLLGGVRVRSGGDLPGGVALYPTLRPPNIVRQSDNPFRVAVFPAAEDGDRVSFYKLISIDGGALFASADDTLTGDDLEYFPGDYIPAELAAGAQLLFSPDGSGGTGVLVLEAAPSDHGRTLGAAQATLTLSSESLRAIVQFHDSARVCKEGTDRVVQITVDKIGPLPARVGYTAVDGTARRGTDYALTDGVLDFGSQSSLSFSVTINDDGVYTGDRAFQLQLVNPDTGTAIAGSGAMPITIVDDERSSTNLGSVTDRPSPPTLGSPTHTLAVYFTSAQAGMQWRLAGSDVWHASGETNAALITGNYLVEFQALAGFRAPLPVTVPVAAAVESATFTYAPLASASSPAGFFSVHLVPDSAAMGGGAWRYVGETQWHLSDAPQPGRPGGVYTIEFQGVAGYETPPTRVFRVGSGGSLDLPTVPYLIAPARQGSSPQPLGSTPAAGDGALATDEPYLYAGQIETEAGFGSGMAVAEHVVLTAGHVLYDDVGLTDVAEVQWFHAKNRGLYEPPPQVPRGRYLFSGYSAGVARDASPGFSQLPTKESDVAVLYFLRPCALGGYSGFLTSDLPANAWLTTSRLKVLAGYPLDEVPPSDHGKLFRVPSPPANLGFSQADSAGAPRVYVSRDFNASGGLSGGALCAQADDGRFFPTAVFLGGTSNALVRAIDSDVVELINRAESASLGGENSTGGGIVKVTPGLLGSALANTAVTCQLSPAIGGWRLLGETNYRSSGAMVRVPGEAQYEVEFAPVAGYVTPPSQVLDLPGGGNKQVLATYVLHVVKPVVPAQEATGLTARSFRYAIRAANSPTAFTLTGALPSGLVYNSRTGVISGALADDPALVRSYPLSVTATNPAGTSKAAPLRLDVLLSGRLRVAAVAQDDPTGTTAGGSVTRGFAGDHREAVGRLLTLVATPARGYIFVEWRGDLSSHSRVLPFTMTEALSLQAIFEKNPYPAFAGTYRGSLRLDGLDDAPQGYGKATVTLGSTGVASAAVQIGASVSTMRIALDGHGHGTARAVRVGQTPLDVTLDLDLQAPPARLLRLQASSQGIPLSAGSLQLSVRSLAEVSTAPFAATLNLALAGQNLPAGLAFPAAPGSLAVTLRPSGVVTGLGKLADGTPVSFGTALNAAGQFNLCAPLYNKTGLITGDVGVLDSGDLTHGVGVWFRPPLSRDRLYPLGWPTGVNLSYDGSP